MLERDAMTCRACGREERASEGYPCVDCERFICLICNFRGVQRCRDCAVKAGEAPVTPAGGTPAVSDTGGSAA